MKIHGGRFLREWDLRELGFAEVGSNVAVHETCVLVAVERMRLGDNVRIDPFCLLSAAGGSISTGAFVHIASHVVISAGAGVELGDFCGVATGAKLLSRSDDFSGLCLTGPTVPSDFTGVQGERPLRIGRHAVVGAGAVVLPNVTVDEGAVVGANSVVKRDLEAWRIHGGAPTRVLGERKQDLLAVEQRFRSALADGRATPPVSLL